jgi:hypothetical protein
MTYAREGINWTAYRSFQQALETAGWDHFPTLRAELPDTNDGVTSVIAAPAMLDELVFFLERADLGWTIVLVDTDTGEELHEYVAAYNGEFCFGRTGYRFGVDGNGFFIRLVAGGAPTEVFRAMRVQQILPDQSSLTPDRELMVEYVDLDSGLRYSCIEPMVKVVHRQGQFGFEYLNRMHVIRRKKGAKEFESVVNSLRTVFDAAVETGNPIRWH